LLFIIIIAAIVSYNANYSYSYIEILDVNYDREVGLFETNYGISGRVINSGTVVSNPVVLKISISTEAGETLYVTETSPKPSILQPGQEASFNKHYSEADIGYYSGTIEYLVEVLQQ
jgi:hypothetical protein